MTRVKTIENALEFVQAVGICTIFSGTVKGIPSLWEVVDLPKDKGGRTKWGPRVEAIWAWKNELPSLYPEDVFYGKIQGGHAVLMSMAYLRGKHYSENRKPVDQCSDLAQSLFEMIRLGPDTTGNLRREAIARFCCTKSRFDTALTQLQVTLNIVRSNDPDDKNDTWLAFDEVFAELAE